MRRLTENMEVEAPLDLADGDTIYSDKPILYAVFWATSGGKCLLC